MYIDVTELVNALESSPQVESVEVDAEELEIRAYTDEIGFVDTAWEIKQEHSYYDWFTGDYVDRLGSDENYVTLRPKSDSVEGFKQS